MSGVWFIICIPTENTEFNEFEKFETESLNGTKSFNKLCKPEQNDMTQCSADSTSSSSDTFSTAPSIGGNANDNSNNAKSKSKEQDSSTRMQDTNSRQDLKLCIENEEKNTDSESEYLIDFVENGLSMKNVLDEALENLAVSDAFWALSQDKKLYQVSFLYESGARCDTALSYLTSRGIGLHKGSTVGIVPCAMFYREHKQEEDIDNDSSVNVETQSDYDGSKRDTKKESTGLKALQRDFLKSITSRLTVAQVVEGVRMNASLTFDFTALIIFASIIAAIGLVENNSIILVASMLISPLMGPILAGTFGAVVQDRSLWLTGTRTEIFGLCLCIMLGFFIGVFYAHLHWDPESWPTIEMSSRGQVKNLLSGAFIALPSGGGVALSILGGNIGSLVGVAISASLLPPAVNAGLLWGLSAVLSHYPIAPTNDEMPALSNTSLQFDSTFSTATRSFVYSDTLAKECAILGVVSLLLTIVNIICIFFAAVAVLKIKEVAPNTNVSKTQRFWKKDIKIARDYNKTLRHGEAQTVGKQVFEEWAKINGLDTRESSTSRRAKLIELHTLKSIVEGVEADDVYRTVMRSLPGGPLTEPLCQSLVTWPVPELISPQSHPSLWDLDLQNDLAQPVENHLRHISAANKAKNFFRTKYMGFSFDSMSNYEPVESISEIDFHNRYHLNSADMSASAASSYSNFLRANRMGLWPPHGRSRSRPSRFVVTPVQEVESPSLHSRTRHVNLPSSTLDTVTTV